MTDPKSPTERVSAPLSFELASLVIDHCVGIPILISAEPKALPRICPRYKPETQPSALPDHFRAEHKRLLRQKWLRSKKSFNDATDFIMIHLACLRDRGAFDIVPALQKHLNKPINLPKVMQPNSALRLTGLEDIELELSTDVFFSMFKVTVPPFPSTDHKYYDDSFLGAGTFLAHTRRLTLLFANSNPWFELSSGPWTEVDADWEEPRLKSNVCTSGVMIDWILTYAWHHKYLQHIPSITLTGDIQPWVQEKWYKVFAGTHPEQEHIASAQRIHDIEHFNDQASVTAGLADPVDQYPPTCRCEIKCSRLRDGLVEPEVRLVDESAAREEWDGFMSADLPVVEMQPWYNRTSWEEPYSDENNL